MKKKGEKLLADIDATLDQLIHNAHAARSVQFQKLEDEEIQALQKTQQSLLARLMRMDARLDNKECKKEIEREPLKRERIHNKIARFGRLNAQVMEKMSRHFERQSRADKKRPVAKTTRIGHNRRSTMQ